MSRRARYVAALIVAVTLVGWLVAREVLDGRNKREAYAVVHELGGDVRSLPGWPFGDEIFVRFRGTQPTRDEVERLTVLNRLTSRHGVGVMFIGTDVSRDDVLFLRRVLPGCAVFRVIDGELIADR